MVILCFIGGPFLGVFVFFFMLAGYSNFEFIGLKRTLSWGKIIAYGLLIALGLQVLSKFFMNRMMDIIFGFKTTGLYDAASESFLGYLWWIFLGVLFSGFFEEFVYRGFLLNHLARAMKNIRHNVTISLIITSVLFGLVHYFSQGVRSILPSTVMGFVFGIIYLKSNRDLWFTIFVHGWFNFISFTMDYIGISEPITRFARELYKLG